MSGHSKWANIKNRKGAQDKKRSEAFTRSSKEILTAIRMGGGNTNPETNSFLKTAIIKSREVNMPKENIERLLKRFEERKVNLITMMLEGFGPHNVPIMVEVETDNKNRILSEIKLIFRDNGGVLGESNSVSFLFEKWGQVELKSIDFDKELEMIDAGVEEIEENILLTKPEDMVKVINKVKELGMEMVTSGVIMKCKNPIILATEEEVGDVLDLVESLEENDDVINVFTGFDYHG